MGENKLTTKLEKQLVVFDLAKESYGVDIGKVSEIIRMQEITNVPKTSEHVEGVINLRGKVIPVIDLRRMFGLTVGEQTQDNRIVVLDINGQQIGIIVDAVTEVLRISVDSVESPSSVIINSDSDYLMGIAKLENKMIILLDLDKVLTLEQDIELSEKNPLSVEETPSEPEMAVV